MLYFIILYSTGRRGLSNDAWHTQRKTIFPVAAELLQLILMFLKVEEEELEKACDHSHLPKLILLGHYSIYLLLHKSAIEFKEHV